MTSELAMGIARGLMRRVRHRFWWIPEEDLLESAFYVLAHAAPRWDPARGVPLNLWLWICGLQGLARDLARNGWLCPRREIPETDAFARHILEDGAFGLDSLPAPQRSPGIDGVMPDRPLVTKLLDLLPSREAKLLAFKFAEGFTVAELSGLFLVSGESIRLRTARALSVLRERLSQGEARPAASEDP